MKTQTRPAPQWVLALLASALTAGNAMAGPVELTVAAGPTAYATSWRGDFGGGATLRAGARFSRVVAVEFQGWESYATVNRRMNTGLSFGIAGYVPLRSVRPFARVFALHQHEEAIVSVENEPAGVLLGIGPGIRHRAGGGLTIGAEFPLKRIASRVEPAFAVSANTTWFPDALGPRWYLGIDLGVALGFAP